MAKAERLNLPLSWYNDIIINKAALKIIPKPWDPSSLISNYKNDTVSEFYKQGLEYLNYKNRAYANKALIEFTKSDKIFHGFMDVKQKNI